MGKKQIKNESEADLMKEEESLESAQKKAINKAAVAKVRGADIGRAYVKTSYNNTIVSMTDAAGNVLAWATAGSLGFKGPKKATPYAATKVVETVMEKLKKTGMQKVMIFVRGIGSGRDAAVRALSSQGMEVLSIKDITPIPHNGCRPPKVRRV